MTVDCVMKDGRTTFRFASRGAAIRVMRRKPAEIDTDDNGRGTWCWRWLIETSTWERCKLQYLNPSSISWVLEVPRERAEEFFAQHEHAERTGDLTGVGG